MALVLNVNNCIPVFGKKNFLAENAIITGDVIMGDHCSVWFNAVIRGDVNSIRIGNKVNIQDGAIIHCTYQRAKTEIGSFVSVGHNAIVHGCTLHDHVLIGMGAILMDGVRVGTQSLVAAGSLLTPGTIIPPRSLVMGLPAKAKRDLTDDEIAYLDRSWRNYVELKNHYM